MLVDVRRWLFWTRTDHRASGTYKWVIQPSRPGLVGRIEEFWRYRRILYFLSYRTLRSQYEGSRFGVLWLFARPLLPILISTFIFGSLLQIPSDGVPYFIFFLAGQASWHTFERSLLFTSRGLSQNQGLLTKVYFPRVMAVFSSVTIAVAWFGAYFGLLILAAFYYLWKDHVWYLRFGPPLLLVPVVIALSLLLSIAIGLWTSVWQLRFREMRYTLRYFTRFWSYLTPVIYPMSQIPREHRWIVYANPMAPIVETFKWALLGIGEFPALPLLCAIGTTLLVLAGGLWYFSWAEASTADHL